MNKGGRPVGTTKEGTHRHPGHPGSMRWHPLVQKHHGQLHERFADQIDVILRSKAEEKKDLPSPSSVEGDTRETLTLLKEIERGLSIIEAMEVIDDIIKATLSREEDDEEKLKWETDIPYGDKQWPFGKPDTEEREVLSVGLP